MGDYYCRLTLPQNVNDDAITFNFRDSTYSPESGVFHPVEIRLERQGNKWHFCYITDFTYLGSGPHAELTKELDFDFQAGVFQNLFGIFPIEQTTDVYQIWEIIFCIIGKKCMFIRLMFRHRSLHIRKL